MARRDAKPRLVAVLNSNDDLVRLIQETLHDEGFLAAHRAMKGRRVILTTNNATALQQMCGVEALQAVGSDNDLGQLLDAVNREFRQLKTGPPVLSGSRLRKLGPTDG